MRSTFGSIEIAKRALFAQNTATQTTNHNIANANTKGYSRQVVNLVAAKPHEAVGLTSSNIPGQIGQSVEFSSITRIREGFLDTQFRNENKDMGNYTIRKDILEKLEAITNEPSNTGIQKVIEKFWSSWQVLSKEPDNTTARAALKENSLAMTESFNHTATQLNALKTDITESIRTKVKESNAILSQVAKLNSEIFKIEGFGNNANDLRDQRDVLVDDLSKIINITVDQTSSGYTVRMGSVELVNGVNVVTSFAETPTAGGATPTPPAGGGASVTFDAAYSDGRLNSGEVMGMIESRDKYLTGYQAQLDSMIKTLVEGDVKVTFPEGSVLPPKVPAGTIIGGTTYAGTEALTDAERVLTADTVITVKGLNALHSLGYTLGNPPESGVPFFTLKSGETEFNATSITVNPNIVTNVAKIASSARVLTDVNNKIVRDANGNETLVKGNNAVALGIATLKDAKLSFDPLSTGNMLLTNGTFDEFFRAIVTQLGVQTQEANRLSTNQGVLVAQVEARRQSVSGVSTDEEMANLIKYQHAYAAAARAMTTYDEMLNKVINGMGLVGR